MVLAAGDMSLACLVLVGCSSHAAAYHLPVHARPTTRCAVARACAEAPAPLESFDDAEARGIELYKEGAYEGDPNVRARADAAWGWYGLRA